MHTNKQVKNQIPYIEITFTLLLKNSSTEKILLCVKTEITSLKKRKKSH